MKNLKIALATACAVVVGWSFTASADIPASAYVQDGLIAQWDGIDNAGTGTHDPAATTWTELKGGLQTTATALTFAGGDHAVFNGTANSGTCVSGSFPAALVAISNGHFTAEARFTPRKYVQYGGLFHFGVYNSTRYFSLSEDDGGFVGAFQYKRNAWDATNCKSGAKATIDQVTNVTAIASGDNNIIYLGTEKISTHKAGTYVKYESTNFQFGRYAAQGNRGMMYLYAVRLYDKVLSEDDIAWNKLIDDCRFSPTPSLYRLTGDGKGVETALRVERNSAHGTVVVGGADIGDGYEGWSALGAGQSVEVSATPAAGWRFAEWQDECGVLTTAERLSPTVTVTTGKPLSLTAVFVFDLSASAYLQGGLIAQWDGIENAGRGLPHDPNATVWSNLVSGTTYDWSLVSGKYVWESDAVNAKSSLSASGWLATMTGVKSIGYTTFETYVQPEAGLAKTTGSFFRQATRKGNVFLMPGNVSGYLTSGQKGANLGFVLGDRFSTTLVYNNDGSAMSAVYKDGVAQTLTTPTYGWAVKDQNMSIGGISVSDTDYVFKGRIHTIRLYNRQLTAAEAACNANIDKIRFEGADPAELAWPTGYRFNAENARIETLLDLSGAEGATVSLDNETFETATNGWYALGASVTAYARPAAGQSIAAWTGLPDGAQVSDDKTTATFSVDAPLSVAAVSHAPMTLRWRGGASEFASDAANWANDGGGAAALPPVSGDAVRFDADSPSMTWDLDEVTLASWTQDEDFTGTVTFQTGPVYEGVDSPTHGVLSADGKRRELIVTGDITLNGGVWNHTATPSITSTHPGWTSGEGVYRLIARAGGNFTIGEKASVLADNTGFRVSQGPGNSGGTGASHGGGGMNGSSGGHSDFVTNVYGRIRTPLTQGSGSRNTAGGGSIELSATGDFTHDGRVSASMTTVADWYTGSAGSIYIKAATLIGKGAFASTSTVKNNGSGAGGRMAFVLTGVGATFDGYSGSMLCYGTSGNARSGTIYLETPDDRDRGGVLLVSGNGATGTADRGRYTTICHAGEDYTFAKVVLSNVVMLAVGPGITLKADEFVSYRNSKDAVVNFLILAGGTVEVPDGYCLKDVNIRNDFTPSALQTYEGEDGTLFLTNGVTCTIDHHVDFVGTLHMYGGSKITQTGNGGTDVGYRANFSAENFILEKGASVDVTAKGFSAGKGPGTPTDEGKAARSGSYGGLAYDVGSVKTYGSITRPVTLGSGGSMYGGGGATHIKVKHSSVVNGSVLASGDYWYFSGSGGSVWIETGTLEGAATGVISADGTRNTAGNDAYKYAGGGGGRIAVTLTDEGADFSGYLGTIRALGPSFSADGKNLAAGYGTVYLRKGGEAENEGTLIVNGPTTKVEGNFTDITDAMTECTVGHVVITNCGNLRVRKGAELKVRQSYANVSRYREGLVNGEPGDDDHAPGAVAFVDASVDATVSGTNLFMCLKCAEPGKTVRFGSAADTLTGVANGGVLSIAGTEAAPVRLRGLTDDSAWLFDFHGKASVAYADVRYSDARAGDKVSVDDTNVDSGENQNWGFVGIKVGDTNVWNGAQNSSWAAAGNWSLGRAPVDTDVIIIPSEAACSPEITEALTLNRLEIAAGKSLSLNGFSLTVTNGVDCLGSIVCTGSEVVTLDGDVTIRGFTAANSTLVLADTRSRTVDLGGLAFRRITVSGAAPSLAFADGFAADYLTMSCAASAFEVVFASGRTVTVGELAMQGVIGDGLAGMTLSSATPGEAWNLKVKGKGSGSGLIVNDSHADGGQSVYAYNPSTRGNNVTGWIFGISEATWQGGASGEWGNPENWSGNAVPRADTCVHFTSDATVTIDVDDATAQILDVADCTVKLAGAKTLTVTSLLEILDGGTLEQAASNNVIHVLGSVYVRSGGTWTHTNNGEGAVDLGLGVNAVVDGDFTIDAGGKVSALGRGYYRGKGLGTTGEGASHGARFDSAQPACYGSMFRPRELGSGGSPSTAAYAGGRIRLNVAGSLTVNGAIDADVPAAVWYNSSGGSILISCGRLAGAVTGSIHADGGNATSGKPGCGGRVAVYQTVATDFGGYAGKITAYGGNNGLAGGSPSRPAGTVYLQPAGMDDYCGTVKIANNRSTVDGYYASGGVDLPVSRLCPDDVKVYRNTTFDISNGGVLSLKGDVTIKELELTSTARLNLEGHTLTIKSHAHKKQKGWPKSWATNCGIFPGKDAEGNPGKIVWEQWGLMIMVR